MDEKRLLTADQPHGATSDVVIRSAQDVDMLLRVHRVPLRPPEGDIVLDLRELDPSDTNRWEERLNAAYHECGCSTGAVTSLGVLVLAFAYLLTQPGGIGNTSIPEVFAVLAMFVVGTAVGKFVGLERARRRLQGMLRSLAAELGVNETVA